MAFSDFKTIPEVLERFRITYTVKDFVHIEEIPGVPSEQFLQEFEFCIQNIDVFASEAARCEAIIFPILKEIYKPYAGDYALWIQKAINYDETLNGTPDYLISTRSELGIPVVGTPLIILVEAKKNDFDQGWGAMSIGVDSGTKNKCRYRFSGLRHRERRKIMGVWSAGRGCIHSK